MTMEIKEIKTWSLEISLSTESTATTWFRLAKETQSGTHHSTTGPLTSHLHHTTTDFQHTRILDKTLSLMDTLFTTPKRATQETLFEDDDNQPGNFLVKEHDANHSPLVLAQKN